MSQPSSSPLCWSSAQGNCSSVSPKSVCGELLITYYQECIKRERESVSNVPMLWVDMNVCRESHAWKATTISSITNKYVRRCIQRLLAFQVCDSLNTWYRSALFSLVLCISCLYCHDLRLYSASVNCLMVEYKVRWIL